MVKPNRKLGLAQASGRLKQETKTLTSKQKQQYPPHTPKKKNKTKKPTTTQKQKQKQSISRNNHKYMKENGAVIFSGDVEPAEGLEPRGASSVSRP